VELYHSAKFLLQLNYAYNTDRGFKLLSCNQYSKMFDVVYRCDSVTSESNKPPTNAHEAREVLVAIVTCKHQGHPSHEIEMPDYPI